MKPAFFADCAAASEKTKSVYDAACADFNFLFDYYVGADENIQPKARARSHNRGGVDSRRRRNLRQQASGGLGESQLRVLRKQQGLPFQLQSRRRKQAPARGILGALLMSRRIHVN